MTKIKPAIVILRPINFLIIILAVMISGLIAADDLVGWAELISASLAIAFSSAAGNVFNDIIDLEIDKKNRPNRILVSGGLSINEAKYLITLLCASSLFFAAVVNLHVLVLDLFILINVFVYSLFFQYKVLIGNLVVSLMTAGALIAGGLAVGNWKLSIIPAIFAFATNFIREIIKDMEDVEGDAKNGVVTFPLKYGFNKSIWLICLITILLMIGTLMPYFLSFYSLPYLLIIITGVYGLFIHIMISLSKDQSKNNLGKLSKLIKLSMVVGLTAIYFGS